MGHDRHTLSVGAAADFSSRVYGGFWRSTQQQTFHLLDVQLCEAVEAVFRSWDSPRARTCRAKEGIDESMGTAVNVQAMVFGNRGLNSGTGVVFTRNPSTGEAVLHGDYLPMAQGSDVVAAHTLPIADLEQLHPAIYTELQEILRRLEVHYRNVCDVEFTIEGRLWLRYAHQPVIDPDHGHGEHPVPSPDDRAHAAPSLWSLQACS